MTSKKVVEIVLSPIQEKDLSNCNDITLLCHCEEALKEPTRQSSNVMRLLRRNKVAPRNDAVSKI